MNTQPRSAQADCIRLLSLPCAVYNTKFDFSRCNHPAIVHWPDAPAVVAFHFQGRNKAFQRKCEGVLRNYSTRVLGSDEVHVPVARAATSD